jgi:hypothetical protein
MMFPAVSEYRVNSQGHILVFEHGAAPLGQWRHRKLLRLTDLDEPSSKKYDGLIGQNSSQLSRDTDAQQWDGLSMTSCWYNDKKSWLTILGLARPQRLLERVGPTRDLQWLVSSTEGVLYGYRSSGWNAEARRRAPPRLEWIVSPEGFQRPTEIPQQRFGRFLASSPSARLHGWSRFAWQFPGLNRLETRNRHFLLFDDGLYEFDPDAQSIHKIYSPPDDKPIISVTTIDDGRVAVVFDDAIHIHAADTVVVGERELKIGLPGKRLASIPIPEEARSYMSFEFGEVADQDLVVFKCDSLVPWNLHRFIHMQADGTVLDSRDLPSRTTGLRTGETAFVCGMVACIPPAITAVAALADAASQTINGTGPGMFIRLLMLDPLAILFALAVVILLSALSGWLAYRTAGRYGFTKSETRWWLSLALLLGPAGLLTLLCLRAWPVRQICHACGKLRPEDLALCVHCETAAEAPPHDGTEILVAT